MSTLTAHPIRFAAYTIAGLIAVVIPLMSSNYVISLFTLVLITALLATSVNMPAGEAGLVSMGHAGISAAAAYGIAYGVKHDFGLGGQLLLALALTLMVSAVFAVTTMRTNGIVFLMITLALGVMVYGIALKWSSVTGGQSGLTGINRPAALSDGRTFYYTVLVLCVVVILLLQVLARSPFGLMTRGVRDNENRMASLGYSIAPVKFVTLMVSGLVAGLAGVLLVWHSEFMSPASAAFDKSAMAVVIIIIGGVGTVAGPLLGSILVVGVQFWLSSYVERWPTLLGLLFIAVVILLPGGLASIATRRSKAGRPGFHPAITSVLAPLVGRTKADTASSPTEPSAGHDARQEPLESTPVRGPQQHDERTP
jgi:branched-chain amino acid transport system permease protein